MPWLKYTCCSGARAASSASTMFTSILAVVWSTCSTPPYVSAGRVPIDYHTQSTCSEISACNSCSLQISDSAARLRGVACTPVTHGDGWLAQTRRADAGPAGSHK